MIRTFGAWALAAGLAAILPSCAGRSTVTTRTIVPTPTVSSAWNGRSVEDIEKVWGAATETESDGEGGTVLVYRTNTAVSITRTEGNAPQGTTGALPDPERTQSEKITKELARFWLDADGKVYRHWFAQEVYESGRDVPPPRDALD